MLYTIYIYIHAYSANQGMNDTRGKVLLHCLDYIKHKRPIAIVAENSAMFGKQRRGQVCEILMTDFPSDMGRRAGDSRLPVGGGGGRAGVQGVVNSDFSTSRGTQRRGRGWCPCWKVGAITSPIVFSTRASKASLNLDHGSTWSGSSAEPWLTNSTSPKTSTPSRLRTS